MSNHNQEITDLNREQMNEGYRADGTPITPKYEGFTIAEKQRKGQRWGFEVCAGKRSSSGTTGSGGGCVLGMRGHMLAKICFKKVNTMVRGGQSWQS